jgi:hypothetical protein
MLPSIHEILIYSDGRQPNEVAFSGWKRTHDISVSHAVLGHTVAVSDISEEFGFTPPGFLLACLLSSTPKM